MKAEFKEKAKGLQFKIDGSVHMIPSKDFPLASKDKNKIRTFVFENTKPIEDDKVKAIFNEVKYRTGKCFYNADDLLKALSDAGEDGWDYYSGWFFIIDQLPVFHTWLAKEDYVLDFTNNHFTQEIADALSVATVNEEMRHILSREIRKLNTRPSSETKIFGQVHKGFMFFGTTDTTENALNTFKNLPKNHISYRAKGMNQYGLSDTQKYINEERDD